MELEKSLSHSKVRQLVQYAHHHIVTYSWRKLFGREWVADQDVMLGIVARANIDTEFARALQTNVTDQFNAMIQEKVDANDGKHFNNNANFFVSIFSQQRSGKSVLARALHLDFKLRYWLKWQRIIDYELAFSNAESMDFFNKLGSDPNRRHFCWGILQDESSTLSGDESNLTNMDLGNILMAGRSSGLNYYKLCPSRKLIEGTNNAIEILAVKRKGKRQMKLTKGVDTSECWTRFLWSYYDRDHKRFMKLGYVDYYCGEALKPKYELEYEKRKKSHFERLTSARGAENASTDAKAQLWDLWGKAILKYALSHDWSGKKNHLEAMMETLEFKAVMREQGLNIAVGSHEKTKFLNTVVLMANGNSKSIDSDAEITNLSSESVLPSNNGINSRPASGSEPKSILNTNPHPILDVYLPDLTPIFNLYKKKYGNVANAGGQRDIEIYQSNNGEALAAKYKISPQAVNQILHRITGFISDELGHDAELWYFPILKRLYPNAEVQHDGSENKPDFRILLDSTHVIYVNLKCYKFTRANYHIYYKKLKAEIDQAQKDVKDGYIASVEAHVYNLYSQKFYYHQVEQSIIDHQVPFAVYSKRDFKMQENKVDEKQCGDHLNNQANAMKQNDQIDPRLAKYKPENVAIAKDLITKAERGDLSYGEYIAALVKLGKIKINNAFEADIVQQALEYAENKNQTQNQASEKFTEQLGNLLKNKANTLEPDSHCCECTPGSHFQPHVVHIQYPNCNCRRENFVLKKNS